MKYSGFWVTSDGVKPTNIKIEAITDMKPTTYQKEVRQFMDVVNYYCNIQPRTSHAIAPLTIISPNKRNSKWTKTKQNAFDEVKRIMDRDFF